MEPPGLAFGEPEDRLREIQVGPVPHSASLDAGYVAARQIASGPEPGRQFMRRNVNGCMHIFSLREDARTIKKRAAATVV